MKEEEIKNILEQRFSVFREYSTIWGKIKPSVAAYHIGLNEVMHLMKNHILHFNSGGIIILPVDDTNGRILEEKIVAINNNSNINFKDSLFHYKLSINTSDGEIEYTIPKNVIGHMWHKRNLSYLLQSIY